MSKIVLCETQEAPYPYKIEKIHRSFSSYEELCYLLEHYIIFFLMEGIDFRMKSYMKEELGIPLENDDAVQQIKEIINYRNYFTADEKQQFQQRLRTTYLYSMAKKQKMLADMYLEHHQYLSAMKGYQALKNVSGQFQAREQVQILYHLGLCQSKMFCFDEAKESFRRALAIKERREVQEAYFMISYLQGDYGDFVKDGEKISFSEERCKTIYDNIKQREEEIKDQDEFVKLKKIDYHRKKADDVLTRRLTKAVLEKWKDEYKKEII